MRSVCVTLLGFTMVLHGACSTTPSPTLGNDPREGLGRLAILASATAPELAFEGFPHSKGEGAAATGGMTLLNCVGSMFHGGCSGEFCGAAAIVMLGVCGVASIAGAVTGAVLAPTAAQAREAEGSMSAVFSTATIQESLRDHLRARALESDIELVFVDAAQERSATAANDFRALAGTADSVLVIGFTRAGTRAAGGDALTLSAEVNARVVHTRDNAELVSAGYRYNGGARSLAAWAANAGEPLLFGLRDAYRQLGAHVFDGIFMLYPFPDRAPHAAGILASAFGLAPVEPATRGQLTGDPLIGRVFEWTKVPSLRPELRWEPFPRRGDRQKAPEDMSQIREVRYDLVIARERDLVPAEIVYERQGLPAPAHRVETTLPGNAHFFWTVRARFELDGRERVTEWSATHWVAAQNALVVPSQWSFRFRTP
jgi:hypothetical protein